jgi:endonuclease/exonuclease/phosphatase family metal-dependent hydrolase
MRKMALAAVVFPALFLAHRSGSAELVTTPILSVAPHKAGELSVLTYNVQDLPWPLAGDRADALSKIGARLATLRKTGSAPHLVVIQEGFSDKSVAMLRAAGYEHIWTGPSSDVTRVPSSSPLDLDFLGSRSILVGESQAPALSSGLIIASAYPIMEVVAAPFPANVCAGIDCLANKGIMLARVKVPGLAQPLDLITTHLNSGRKSRTSVSHHLYAYRRQLEAVTRFLQTHRDLNAPSIFAGDFNVSHSRQRLEALTSQAVQWRMAPVTAMGKPKYQAGCKRAKSACKAALPIAANVPLIHTLDWQFQAGSMIEPLERTILFGRENAGTMLSDHVGYSVRYRIKRAASST